MDKPQKTVGAINAILLLVVAGSVDIIQIILDFFVIGLVVNRVIDVIMGLGLALWFRLLGISVSKHLIVYISLAGGFIIEAIPPFDIAPAWTLDVIYTIITMRGEDKKHNDHSTTEAKREQEQIEMKAGEENIYEEQRASYLQESGEVGEANVPIRNNERLY